MHTHTYVHMYTCTTYVRMYVRTYVLTYSAIHVKPCIYMHVPSTRCACIMHLVLQDKAMFI